MRNYLTLIVRTALVSLIFLIPEKSQGMNEGMNSPKEFSEKSQKRPFPTGKKSENEIILSHVSVMREFKKNALEKQTKALDEKWADIFKDKTLDDLKEYLQDTVTGKFLIDQSNSRNKSIVDCLKSIISSQINEKLNEQVSILTNATALSADELYKELEGLIHNEIKYGKDYFVFYTGANLQVTNLFYIITELSNYSSISREQLKLRFSIDKTATYFDSMEDYIDAFYNQGWKYTGKSPLWPDWTPFAHQTLLSANFSFLSNLGEKGESTLHYFLNNVSIHNTSYKNFKTVLRFYLKDEKLIEKRIEQYNKTLPARGSGLIQVLIKKDKVDLLAYLCGMGGIPYVKSQNGITERIFSDEIYPNDWKNLRENPNGSFDERVDLCIKVIEDTQLKFRKLWNQKKYKEAQYTPYRVLTVLVRAKEDLERTKDWQRIGKGSLHAAEQKRIEEKNYHLDPFEPFMSQLATKLEKTLEHGNDIEPSIHWELIDPRNHPLKIYQGERKLLLQNKETLFRISEFLSNYLESKPIGNLSPFKAQARIVIKPEFLDPDSVKINVITRNNTSPEKLALYRKKLAELVQEDIIYYLEHTPKEEREENKLETLKGEMEKGKKVERPSPPIGNSQEYNDPAHQGLGRVVS